MAEVVLMPQFGHAAESCLVTAWRVEIGQTVAADTDLCDVEAGKSAMKVPAGVAGVLLARLAEVGDKAPAKLPLAVIGARGEDVSALLAGLASSAASPTSAASSAAAASSSRLAPPAPAVSLKTASPRARELAAVYGIAIDSLTGTGPRGRIIERDVMAAVSGPLPAASPAVAPEAAASPTSVAPPVSPAPVAAAPAAEPAPSVSSAPEPPASAKAKPAAAAEPEPPASASAAAEPESLAVSAPSPAEVATEPVLAAEPAAVEGESSSSAEAADSASAPAKAEPEPSAMSAASLSEPVGVAAADGESVPAAPAESPAEPAGETISEVEPTAAEPVLAAEPAAVEGESSSSAEAADSASAPAKAEPEPSAMSAASLSETVGVAAAGGEPVPAVPAESPSAESPAEPAGEAPREDEPAAAKPEPSSEPAPSPAVSIVESALETEPSAVGPESAVEAEPAVEPESAAVSAEASAEPVAESAAEAGPDGSLTFQTPLREACKPTAARSRAALAGHVQASFDTSAPAANLLNLRRRLKSSDPALGMAGVTIGDLVAYAAVQVARRHPTVNAIVVGDVATACEDVHLGLAVDTPRGLVVPTIRNASSLGLRQFSAQANELAALARSGPIGADLLSGATFTVANLGAYGIESFTPVLSVPQAAILGANTIFPRPVIRPDGSYGVEQRIGFSLTVDHEVVDGADAARYLADLVTLVADIDIAVLD